MPQIAKPDGLQPGSAAKEFYDELHDLHALAGWPSTRDLGKKLDITAASVYNVFHGDPLIPHRPRMLKIVAELAELALLDDGQGETQRFHILWIAARAEVTSTNE